MLDKGQQEWRDWYDSGCQNLDPFQRTGWRIYFSPWWYKLWLRIRWWWDWRKYPHLRWQWNPYGYGWGD